MVGVDQCGISDTIEFILQYYPIDVQQRLVDVSIGYHYAKFNSVVHACVMEYHT